MISLLSLHSYSEVTTIPTSPRAKNIKKQITHERVQQD